MDPSSLVTLDIVKIPCYSHVVSRATGLLGQPNIITLSPLVSQALAFTSLVGLSVQRQVKIAAPLFVTVFMSYFTRGRRSYNKIYTQIQKSVFAGR